MTFTVLTAALGTGVLCAIVGGRIVDDGSEVPVGWLIGTFIGFVIGVVAGLFVWSLLLDASGLF